MRLTRGQSAGGVWEIDQQYPQARLAIGSDPNAGWAVVGAGVRPVHFELYWDGRCLFVADTQRAGGVTLNGMAVGGDWLQVRGRGEVTFGQAAMAIETSDGTATALPDPASARRISAAEGPSKQHNLAELTGEATRMTDSPFDGPPSLTGEATRIQDSPLDAALAPPMLGGARPPPPPPPGGAARPRLGGDPQPAALGQAKTLMQDELAGAVGEATRMVAMPDTPGPPPYGAPAGGMPPPMMAPAAPLADPTGPPAAPFGAPAPPATGGFAAPPGYGEGGPPKKAGGTPFGLPPRTLALAGVLILGLVVLGFVGFGDDEEDYEEYVDPGTAPVPATAVAPPPTAPLPPPTAPTTTSQIQPLASGVPTTAIAPIPTVVPATAVPATAVPVTGLPPITTAIPVPTVVAPPATIVAPVPTAVPATTVPPATGVVDPNGPVGPTPERVAADRVLAGRYDEALPLYQALAAQHPERPEYSAMVRILEGRLRAQCVNGVGPDGRPCAVP